MKKIFFLSLFSLAFAGCKVGVGTSENTQFKVTPALTEVNFEALKSYVLTPSCLQCHAWASDEAQVQQRIVLGNPEASVLYQKIKSGSMPPSGALSTANLSIVEKYIIGTKSAPPIQTIPINSTFKSVQFHLINKSCIACHNDHTKAMSFEGYAKVRRHADEIIDILDIGEAEGTPMPPYDKQGNRKAPVPTEQIVEAFRTWISNGKLDN